MKLLVANRKFLPFIVGLMFSVTLAIIVLRGILFVPGRLDTGDLSFFNDIGWYRQEHSWADICSLPYVHYHYIILYPLSWLVNDVGNLARLTYFVIFTVMAFTSFTVVFAQTLSKCKRIESCYAATFTASAIYTLNPYVLGIVGWFFDLFGYAIFPLFIYFIPKMITTPSRWRAVQYALISALFLALELINAYEFTVSFVFCLLILLTLTIVRIREKPKESLLRFTLSVLTILIVPSLLGAFILLPSFVLGGTVIPWSPLQLWQLYAPAWANFKIYDVFRLWKWSLETTPMKTHTSTIVLSLIVPIAAWLFLIAILVKKRLIVTVERTQKQFTLRIIVKEWLTTIVEQDVKWVILVISIVGIILAMGVSGPLGLIIVWASFNLPFASFKRTEFWIRFLSLSYSLLCGFLVAAICERKQSDVQSRNLSTFGKFIKRLTASKTVIILVLILVASTSFVGPDFPFQVLSGNFGRLINPAVVPSAYDDLNKWLSSQEGVFRTFWIPFGPPTWGAESVFNFAYPMAAWLNSRPVVIANQPNERDYMSFLLEFMGKKQMSQLLGQFSVKYIIFHNDTTDDYETKRTIYQNLIRGNELELVYQRDFIYVFRNKQFQPYLTTFNSEILSISSLRALDLSYYIPEFNLSSQAIIFPEQYENMTNQLIQTLDKDDTLLFYGHNFTDLALSNLSPQYMFAPTDYMKYNIGYWDADTLGTDFNYDFSYGKGIVYSNTNGLNFSMNVNAESSTDYQIWVRFYAAPSTGGKIDIFIDGVKVGSVDEDTTLSEPGFIWMKVAECWLGEGIHKLTFVSENTLKTPNVNLIAVVPSVKMKYSWNTLLDVIQKSNVRLVYVLTESDLKTSDPRSLPGSITIFDNSNLTFFNPVAWDDGIIGEPVLSNENALKIQVGTGNHRFWGLVHNYTSHQNWNSSNILLLHWHGNSTGRPIAVRVWAPDVNNMFVYEFLDDFNGWKYLVLPLDSFRIYSGNPSWEYVSRIDLLTLGGAANLAGTWALDYIGLTTSLAKNVIVYIPRNGDYTVTIRTTDSAEKANITLGIDSQQIDKPTHKETFQNLTSYYFLLRNLTEGFHNLTVFVEEPVNITSVVIFSSDDSSITTLSDVFKNKEISPIIKYEKVSSEKWIVTVNASRPFMLAFSEPYYDLWQASAEGTTFNNFPLFSQINGYFIDKSGNYVIEVHFTLQNFMEDGLIMSGTTLSLTIVLLVFIEYKIRKRARIKKET